GPFEDAAEAVRPVIHDSPGQWPLRPVLRVRVAVHRQLTDYLEGEWPEVGGRQGSVQVNEGAKHRAVLRDLARRRAVGAAVVLFGVPEEGDGQLGDGDAVGPSLLPPGQAPRPLASHSPTTRSYASCMSSGGSFRDGGQGPR